MAEKLQAPFPYFGGKSMIADVIWQYLGDVEHYIEPFFGSGAVLLNRPNYDPQRHTETICEIDPYLANVWRALKYNPEEVAKYCDNAVSHVDLFARRKYLMRNRELLEKMIEDEEYYDAKMAGYWIWCSNCWIGNGMLSGSSKNEEDGYDTLEPRPNLIDKGHGVNKLSLLGPRPHLGDKGRGVNKSSLLEKRPHLTHKGMGVNKISLLTESTTDICETIHNNILAWLKQLSNRIRLVRMVCGDWSKVCGGDWQDSNWKTVGIYFDPPYSSPSRHKNLYHVDSMSISEKVAQWALERGKRENYRIVTSGYDDEKCYESLLDNGWRLRRWKAQSGYANLRRNNQEKNMNKHKEILLISPHCVSVNLFEDLEKGGLYER